MISGMAICRFSCRRGAVRRNHCCRRSSCCVFDAAYPCSPTLFRVSIAVLFILSVSSISVVDANAAISDQSLSPGCHPAYLVAFDDVVSRTFASSIVFDGQLIRHVDDAASSPASGTHRTRHQNKRTGTTWTAEFRIQAILKNGEDDETSGSSNSVVVNSLITVTSASKTSSSSSGCDGPSVAPSPSVSLNVGGRYFVFVGGPLSAGDGAESGTSTRLWKAIGDPMKYSKKTVKLIKANSCTDCGR